MLTFFVETLTPGRDMSRAAPDLSGAAPAACRVPVSGRHRAQLTPSFSMMISRTR